MKTIVFASMNPKKAEEIQRIAPKCINVLSLKDIPEAAGIPQAEENGRNFLENATSVMYGPTLRCSSMAE